jgi:hypothetical protein
MLSIGIWYRRYQIIPEGEKLVLKYFSILVSTTCSEYWEIGTGNTGLNGLDKFKY